jgi:hypothetical protein
MRHAYNHKEKIPQKDTLLSTRLASGMPLPASSCVLERCTPRRMTGPPSEAVNREAAPPFRGRVGARAQLGGDDPPGRHGPTAPAQLGHDVPGFTR